MRVKNLFVATLCLLLMAACKHKKPTLSGNKPMKAKDFISAFPNLSKSFYMADTNINRNVDTTNISTNVLKPFIKDSVLQLFTKNYPYVRIHPVGKIIKPNEAYILLQFEAEKEYSLVVFVLNEKHRYLAHKVLLCSADKDEYVHTVTANNEPTFTISQEKYSPEKQLMFTRTGWAYMGGNAFQAVMNDGNEDKVKNNTVINPIDSLPQNFPLSGNYSTDTQNYIALRDGKKKNIYLFFIHFEKKNGTCIGELKGEMTLLDEHHAQFNENGDPCAIDFTFEGKEIVIKENSKCGNHRGIQCYFNERFKLQAKKKPMHPKKQKPAIAK